jgi:hypothetical protein
MPERVNSRNGYGCPEWDARGGDNRAGDCRLTAIPKLRQESYFPVCDYRLAR